MCTSCPSNRIRPLSAACVPATHLTSVDLPAPLSPTRAITSPSRTSKSTSSSACTDPNAFEMPRSSRVGASLMRSFTTEEAPRTGASSAQALLLAELLEGPDAHLVPLEEALLEEERVVLLRDRDGLQEDRRNVA